ncbi:hypothetical protein ACGIF2_10805 [Cellulomonas sp. P22]|uniref:hypothetical protein n=1 Tax=Cellulomonas sp. P22 TaxID=3373189 RepID=UPI0037AF5E77
MCATAVAVLCTLTGLSHWITFGGALGAFVVWHLWRLPQGRGLSAVDARVLSGARALMPDVAANIPDRVRWLGGAITGGTLAFFGAVAVVSVVMEVLLADAYQANMATFDAVAWPLVWLATVIGGAAGPHLLRGLQAKATRQYVDQLRSTQVECVRGCVCLSTIGMRGIETDAYTSRHLHAAEPEVVAMVPVIPTATVQALQCPVSHTPWLLVRLPGREALLFRGTLERLVDAPGDAVGGYL